MALLLVCATLAVAQDGPRWETSEKRDALRGVINKDLTLHGKYLTAPQKAQAGALPAIELRCAYDPKAKGKHAHGEMLEARIALGMVAASSPDKHGDALTRVHYRLNEGKLQDEWWQLTADQAHLRFEGFATRGAMRGILTGHLLPFRHKGDLDLDKIIIGVEEFQGREVVMQFDLPESEEVAASCGTVWK